MIASPLAPGAAGSGRFAGREAELAVLSRAADAAQRAEPQVVIVEGQAGMGKSALLGEFSRKLPDGGLAVRLSCGEPESRLPYWLVGQLLSGMEAIPAVRPPRDPLAAGTHLAEELKQTTAGGRLVAVIIDDIHWADPESATGILHALRRMQTGTLLTIVSARPRGLGQLGGGSWRRFTAGDHRARKISLGGFGISDVQALARAAGTRELTECSAASLVHCTGGRPGYCRAVLDEAASGSMFRPLAGELASVPREIADYIGGFSATVSPAAHELLEAAAVLGVSCGLSEAAETAGLTNPVKVLAEIAETGLLDESPLGGQIQFADPVSQLVIYRQLGMARRRELHRRAAGMGSAEQRLRHRCAAVDGPDAELSAELDRAGHWLAGDGNSAGRGEQGQGGLAAAEQVLAESGPGSLAVRRTAAIWLARAAELAPDRADRDRLVLDALEVLLRCGEAAAAGELATMAAQAGPSWRRDALLGWTDLLTGQFARAEERLNAAHQADVARNDPVGHAHALTGLLWCHLHAGRLDEAVLLGWQAIKAIEGASRQSSAGPAVQEVGAGRGGSLRQGAGRVTGPDELAVTANPATTAGSVVAAGQATAPGLPMAPGPAGTAGLAVAGDLAVALAWAGRGAEAMAALGSLPVGAGEAPLAGTEALAARGIVRVVGGDFEAAVTDLSVVAWRLEAGCAVRLGGLAVGFLAEAEFQLGDWGAAAQHADLAIGLTCESGRTGELSLLHALAALVPCGRGDGTAASGHIEAAGKTARRSGSALGIAAWASARAGLALARGDYGLALRAAQTARDTGREEALGRLRFCPWSLLEAEALIALGRPAEARARLKEAGSPGSSGVGQEGKEQSKDLDRSRGTGETTRISEELTVLRLQGLLATESLATEGGGDSAAAAAFFVAGRDDPRAAAVPYQLAQLELAAGRGLRLLSQRPEAIAWLRAARGRLVRLGAAPAVAACDQELAACGVQTGREVGAATLGLTPTELAVASLVAAGRSNRQAAAELYVSIKGIEFHLRNIFAKLGIRSRKDLADRLGDDADVMTLA